MGDKEEDLGRLHCKSALTWPWRRSHKAETTLKPLNSTLETSNTGVTAQKKRSFRKGDAAKHKRSKYITQATKGRQEVVRDSLSADQQRTQRGRKSSIDRHDQRPKGAQ